MLPQNGPDGRPIALPEQHAKRDLDDRALTQALLKCNLTQPEPNLFGDVDRELDGRGREPGIDPRPHAGRYRTPRHSRPLRWSYGKALDRAGEPYERG